MFKTINKNKYQQSAFTIIELLVVISVIGVLSTVVLVSTNGAREKARISRAIADMRQIATAANLYLNEYGYYPCFDSSASIAWEVADTNLAKFITWPTPPWSGTLYGLHNQGSFGVAIYLISPNSAQLIDNSIDDGNLNTGRVISSVNIQGYKVIYSFDSSSQPQSQTCY